MQCFVFSQQKLIGEGHYLNCKKNNTMLHGFMLYDVSGGHISYHTSLYLIWNTQGESLKAQAIQLS